MSDEDYEVGGTAMADMTAEWIRFGFPMEVILSRLRAFVAAYPHRPEPQATLDAMTIYASGGISALSIAAEAANLKLVVEFFCRVTGLGFRAELRRGIRTPFSRRLWPGHVTCYDVFS